MLANLRPIVRKMETLLALTPEERRALESLQVRVVDLEREQAIVRQGDSPSRSAMVLKGLVCTSKTVGDGRRQILAFHIAGDMPGLQSLHLKVLDSDVVAMTQATVALVDHKVLRDLCLQHPRLGLALWHNASIDSAIFREWIANIGQRQAMSRVAHVFCEMMLRMRVMGLAQDNECALPLTQSELSDATGMSVIHINRSLQELRKTRYLSFAKGVLKIDNWPALAEIADFDPGYLHLDAVPGAEQHLVEPG